MASQSGIGGLDLAELFPQAILVVHGFPLNRTKHYQVSQMGAHRVDSLPARNGVTVSQTLSL